MIEGLPLPATDDPLDAPFWASARRGRLVVQCCGDCGEMRFPPRPMCPSCQSEAVEWREDDGEATVWSFAVPGPPLLPALEAMLPYVVIIGALASNPAIRMAGMAVVDDAGEVIVADPTAVAIGGPVSMRFRAVGGDCSLPVWRIAAKSMETNR